MSKNPSETDKETSPHGGTLTVEDLENYRKFRTEQVDEDIQMYIAHHIHKRSLQDVANEYGLSTRESVRYRLNKMLGEININKRYNIEA